MVPMPLTVVITAGTLGLVGLLIAGIAYEEGSVRSRAGAVLDRLGRLRSAAITAVGEDSGRARSSTAGA